MVQATLLKYTRVVYINILMTSFLKRRYIIQDVFHFFQFLKLEPSLLGIFYALTVIDWNNFAHIIKSSELNLMLRERLLNLVRPKCNKTYRTHHPPGLNLG